MQVPPAHLKQGLITVGSDQVGIVAHDMGAFPVRTGATLGTIAEVAGTGSVAVDNFPVFFFLADLSAVETEEGVATEFFPGTAASTRAKVADIDRMMILSTWGDSIGFKLKARVMGSHGKGRSSVLSYTSKPTGI